MNRQLILGLDIGTSSVRAGLCDLRGRLLPKTLIKIERTLRSTVEGGAEIDAEIAFHQVVAAIDRVLETSRRSEIIAVTASSFWHSLVGVGRNGEPTTKVLGWADNRSRKYVRELRKKFDEQELHHRTGARFHSSFWPAKLLWFKREQAEVFARTARWLSFSDYVAQRLLDTTATSVSMASATGIFDQRRCVWDEDFQKFFKIRKDKLPTIAADTDSFLLNRRYARRWPRLADAKWFLAIGDGAANNIGAGCTTPSRAGLMIGTSGAMRVAYRNEPPSEIPSGLWCYRIDGTRVILGGALSDGGGLYKWLQDNLRVDSSVEREIARRVPDGHGLSFMPFLAGERSTGYHEFAAGAVLGMTSRTDVVDITQAAMESVAYRFAEIFDQLKSVAKVSEIVASGGALRESHVWAQIIANVLGRKISLVEAREASLRGAVLLALESLGNIGTIETVAPEIGQVFRPSTKAHAVYDQAEKRHRRFYHLILQNK